MAGFKLFRTLLPIGLDWTSRSLRALQLQAQGREFKVGSMLETALPESCWELPDPEDESRMLTPGDNADTLTVTSLRRLYELGGFRDNRVVLHCPADRLDVRQLSFPAGPEGLNSAAIVGAIRMQVGESLPFNTEQAVIDFIPLRHDREASRLSVVAVCADGEWVRRRVRLLEKAALQCIGCIPLPLVLTRLATHTTSLSPFPHNELSSTEKLTGILDMGHRGSTLIVMREGRPLFSRRFSFGGREMTEALSAHLLVPPEHAERLKCSYGLACMKQDTTTANSETAAVSQHVYEGSQGSEVSLTLFNSIRSELEAYIEALIRSLNYVITDQGGASLTHVLVCGGTGYTHGLTDFLSQQFEIPVTRLCHPLLEQAKYWLPESRDNLGSWVTAMGLALQQVDLPGSPRSSKSSVPKQSRELSA